MTSALRVVSAGGIGMIQDLGRVGMQRLACRVGRARQREPAPMRIGNTDSIRVGDVLPRTDARSRPSVRVAAVGAPGSACGRARRPVPPAQRAQTRRAQSAPALDVAVPRRRGRFTLPGFSAVCDIRARRAR
jgi:hypothetical protein